MSDLRRILIVDDSRMVRASLGQHLNGVYEIREEENGESAWQTLVLDHSIKAVISDLQMPVLDGFGLLERVRGCKLKRLREIPFVLISGDDDVETMERAERMGVSDFINKGINAAELKTRLGNLLQFVDTRQSLEEARTMQTQDPDSGLFTRRYIELQTAQALSHALRHNTTVSLMIIGFDRYAALVDQLGEHKASEIALRFARQVASKVRREDSLGHFSPGHFAIVSPGTTPESCVVFAERLRRAVAEAAVISGGKRLNLTMSVGVSSVPMDQTTAAGALIDLACERMESAVAAGGNCTKYGAISPAATTPATTVPLLNIGQALESLRERRPEVVLQQLGQLGEQLLPLLALMQDELGVNLQLDELRKKLRQRRQTAG
ncbi:diguanylate cyclase response regulator [Betaproteobacteria bacterium]|nr:diguanylate cyclase response regulator [Betaproteobacteria bacterium]